MARKDDDNVNAS